MASFEAATTVEGESGHYRARLDPEWWAAWGPYGGYVAALAMRAIGRCSALPRAATFSGMFLAAADEGEVAIAVTSLKRSKRAEALRVHISQRDKPMYEAQCWMVDTGLDGLTHDYARFPQVSTPAELRSFADLVDDYASWYPFWQHVEGRPQHWEAAEHHRPREPHWLGWLRLRSELPADDPVLQAARAIAWMDMATWNAASLAHEWPTPHIAVTLDLNVQLYAPLYETEAAAQPWMLLDGRCPTASDGVLGGTAWLWSPAGRLLGAGMSQCMCRPNPSRK